MKKILLSKLIEGLADVKKDCYIDNVVTDSRMATNNSVFLAIKGDNVNGEDYAHQAVDNGAKLVITENFIHNIEPDLQCVVTNILDASIQMGANFRKQFQIDIIGVTGSVGKTTTKDFIYTAISNFNKTIKSEGNQNNELGMPNTIYRFTDEDKYAILEMGMTQLNDIHKLSLAAKPTIGVITCIGVSHLQNLKTQENILKAKLEICDGMDLNDTLILNGDDKFLANAKISKPKNIIYIAINNKNANIIAKDIIIQNNTTKFTIVDNENVIDCIIPTIGNHNVLNALFSYAVAKTLKLDTNKAVENLKNYTPSGMRQKIVEKNDITYIEDCYNASPDSMKALADTMQNIDKSRKIAVLGDMLELGDETIKMHREVGEYFKNKNIDILLAYGDLAKYICEGFGETALQFKTKEELAKYIINISQKDDIISFKASRGMAFEEIISMIYKN